MRKIAFLTLFFALIGALPSQAVTPAFYTVDWKDGKAWFVKPNGKSVVSMGVNAIADQSYRAPNDHFYDPVKNQYDGKKSAWLKGVFIRLNLWRFNTIGCWADEDLLGKKFPYTFMLWIGRGNPWDKPLESVFTEAFEARVKENVEKMAKFKNDPDLIGYFLDNELPWWGDYGWKADGQKSLLEKYALSGVDDANKEAFKKFIKDNYADDVDGFNREWSVSLKTWEDLDAPVTLAVKTRKQKLMANAWAGRVAERYFEVAAKAVRAADPNHLLLGVRFAGEAPWEVVEACGRYCDVVSVNHYAKSGDIDRTLLDNFFVKTKKPILITEYSFSAKENQSGDPCTHGADVSVATQKERVEHFERYARQALDLPYLVGLHWFEWSDESPEGRFDGEDQNYGLVDIHDKEYKLLAASQTAINKAAAGLHEKSSSPLPAQFKEPVVTDYRKAEPGTKVPDSRAFLKFDASLKGFPWGDATQRGKMTLETLDGTLALNYESGTGWGCGASFPPNLGPFTAPNVLNLLGYNMVEVNAFVPKGVDFSIYMAESGAADPSSSAFNGVSGADGETYSFPSFIGTGKWETYRIALTDLETRSSWGNQHGNHILDLQAIADVEFYIHGNQGTGKFLVKDLTFRVK